MKTYFVFQGDGGNEILVLPSITPNPSQKRIGIRIGAETVWLRAEEATDFAKKVKEEAKP